MGKRRLERPNAYRRTVNNAEVCYRSTSPDLKEGEALTLSSERRGDGLSRYTVNRESAFQTNREKNDRIKSLISALTFAGGLHLEPLTGGKAAKGGRGRRRAHCDPSACGRRPRDSLSPRSCHQPISSGPVPNVLVAARHDSTQDPDSRQRSPKTAQSLGSTKQGARGTRCQSHEPPRPPRPTEPAELLGQLLPVSLCKTRCF